MPAEKKLYGLVVCGGNSSRMGSDKSMLVYFQKPQRYHVYEMLQNICDRVFISCNSSQQHEISREYEILVDLPNYRNTGPMAALLTAFSHYQHQDFLAVGCDYPFVSARDIKNFLRSISNRKKAAAFYDCESELYEPLLAFYPADAADPLLKLFDRKQYSLQYFLRSHDAFKYNPPDIKTIKSIDTPEDFVSAKTTLRAESYMQ